MRKAMIALVVLSFLVSIMMTGCSEGEKSEEVGKSEEKVLGKYFNEDDFKEYVKLKADGTVYCREKYLGVGEYIEGAGKWKIDEEEIVFIWSQGDVNRGKIRGNTLYVDDKVWVSHGGAPKTSSKKISKSKIVGKYKYVIEEGGMGTSDEDEGITIFKKNGTLIDLNNEEIGEWKIENGLLQIYNPATAESASYQIWFEGDDMIAITEMGKVRFIKQD